MKASDVFEKSQPAFGRKTSFEEAFPTIKKVIVNVEESDAYGRKRDSSYTGENMGEYIDCSNHKCYNGGFSIGHILRMMIREKKSDSEMESTCRGYEGSPKGRRHYGSCDRYFKVKVHIDYKESG